MAASLPLIPRLVFAVLEPLSLVAGFVGAVHDPAWFAQQQLPPPHGHDHDHEPAPVAKHAIVLALQLGNMYLLLFLVGAVVLFASRDPGLVRRYLAALWLADLGHIAFSCYGLGRESALAPAAWNAAAWGNIGFTSFLCLVRSAYLTGLFGPDRPPMAATAARKAK